MQQKTTVERVLHYIGRKLRKDADGNEVISRHHAELAAKIAFEGGRQSVVDNIPDLEWKETLSDGETYWLAKPMGGIYMVSFVQQEDKVFYCDNYIAFAISVSSAKQMSHKECKQRIKQALGL